MRGGARHAPHGAKGAAGTRGDGSQLERCSRDSRQRDTLCHRWDAPCRQWDALCNWGYALCHRWDICVTSGMSPVAGGCAVSPVGRAVALAWLVVRRAVADDGLHRGKEGATGRAVALARGREGLVVTGERTPGSRPKLLAPGEAGQHHRTAGHEPPPRAPVSPPGAWGLRWPRGQGTPSPASTTCHQGIRSGPGRGARALNSQ